MMRTGKEANGGHGRSGLRLCARLTGLAMLSCVIGACDPGPETRDPPQDPGRAIEPDPQLGEQPADIDIGERAAQEEGAGELQEEPAVGAADAGSEQVAATGSTGPLRAFAELQPTEGNDVRGDASFIETEEGLEIVATLTGLSPGLHGIHLHENGDCSNNGSAAGDHFAPDGDPHGAPVDEASQHHAGDFGNISPGDAGTAELRMTDDGLEIEGELGVVGRALVVHEGEDDFVSQPDGDSGDPVACGVVEIRGTG